MTRPNLLASARSSHGLGGSGARDSGEALVRGGDRSVVSTQLFRSDAAIREKMTKGQQVVDVPDLLLDRPFGHCGAPARLTS
jgi:hypothetical protein